MATDVNHVQHKSRPRRKRRAGRAHQRLDIQGLRMVAVLTVFAFHLCGWPRGGFIGVDVFFVISGFLITGNLLRMAESRGNVSFKRFYWNRVRRIIPAATVVLACTYAASVLVYLPFRAHQVGADAVFAFFFISNWRFAFQETDYFAAGDAVSPIQHYWSLSIEEQFYFVWPALIFLIGLAVARKAWSHGRRMGLAAAVMACVVVISLGWALYETAIGPTWAYFDTLARVWELGVGALLATAVGALARIPVAVKPWLSWAGLGIIASGLLLITEGSVGFPAPWALLPVTGAALVIAAGVRGEPAQGFLRNRVSVYVGNVSYSLYLVHWPVIVILGALVPHDGYFYLAAVALTFGLSIGSYHFVENPMRQGDWRTARSVIHEIQRHRFQLKQSSRQAAVAMLVLLTVGLTAYVMQPSARSTETPLPVAASPQGAPKEPTEANLGPLALALQQQITTALAATQWPHLDPSMESGISETWPIEIIRCSLTTLPSDEECTWGSPSAPTRITLVGDSVAMHYANSLRHLALNSDGQIQVHVEAMGGCPFANDRVFTSDPTFVDACPARKQHAVDYINANTPTVVIISNWYEGYRRIGVDQAMTSDEWFDSVRQMVAEIRNSTAKFVWLSAPPADKNIVECYGKRSSVPTDCISRVTSQWLSMADTEQRLAESVGGVWVDSRPWFCSADGLCPSFVGSTPTKHDKVHSTRAYEEMIYPVIGESLRAAGVF
ncbi:acyltransferase [Mycolicibacterium sp. P9-64]|uniref:acyltransferase family protein n=1 Tax=Mycolicibacterium sp. P9-64 TaxID=2024612 RepID=UPI0011F097A9|nr:acyltransferase family protein [Mycolicibacterium sp. P9-64]KAA0079113.1 acyltransferase [Mycolicibacterium sp. P9-64]